MKYSKLSILALATVGLFSACTKLDQNPQSSLNDSDAVTEGNARILANGVYQRMKALEYYGRDFMIVSDLGGNDMKITSQNSNRFITEFQMNYTPLLAPQTNTWLNVFRVITQANVLINKLPQTGNTATIIGEAYFMRALADFDLMRRYTRPYTNVDAKPNDPNSGIPVISTVIDNPATYKATRNTLEESYNAVISDLKVAQQTAPDAQSGSSAIFTASKDAATALLTRVYLYKGQWQQVIDEASKLLDGNKYPLYEASAVAGAFNLDAPGSEEIFSVRFVNTDGGGASNFGYMYVPAASGGYGDIRLTAAFMDLLDDKDVRKGHVSTLDGSNYLVKFSGNKATGQVGLVNVKVLRISEVLLSRAEAYAELNNFQKATDDVNALRAKRGLDPFTDVANIKAEIIKQRRLELVGEGFSMSDLFRKNGVRNITDANALSTRVTQPNDFRVAYPIPQSEIDANSKMVQNPGYSK
ncbi:RagB/SusD family nutrient uptake outer membrane protein [Chitinophaga sp. 30R24]|uniref:RagB/SusD family nutrient uptake outer membrane protein n=1 Tax=Chitinophaga sp. 30R24 TaxID=3248838 RepID=UPI003B91F727